MMMLRRRPLVLGLLAVALLPRQVMANGGSVQRASAPLLGTQVDITVSHPDADLRRQALGAAWREMLRQSEMMSRYRSASQVSALARAAGTAAVPVAPELMQVLLAGQQLARDSEGHFDLTVGAYADWGFEPGQAHMAEASALRRQQRLVDYRDLQLDSATLSARLRRPGMRLDLGGIAKLPILQAGLRSLQSMGIRDALINGGGDVLCSGQLQGRDWRIGLRDPREPAQLLGVLSLSGGVVAASGDYERGFDLGGRRYHHILDPRNGQPSQGLQGLALVARDVEAVNGWGAAMMVAGAPMARRWLAAMPGVEAMLAGPQGLWLSPGLRGRLASA
ncbi:FAD:protein FMN transferase [Roseateles microcysteis]